jgi:hypothetical protein
LGVLLSGFPAPVRACGRFAKVDALPRQARFRPISTLFSSLFSKNLKLLPRFDLRRSRFGTSTYACVDGEQLRSVLVEQSEEKTEPAQL